MADASVCKGNAQKTLSTRVFQCTLKERFRVQVQAGDILGLELPPSDDRDFLVHFTSGGSTNYVFESQLSSAVILSNRNHNEVQEQPQVNVTVEALSISGNRWCTFTLYTVKNIVNLTHVGYVSCMTPF